MSGHDTTRNDLHIYQSVTLNNPTKKIVGTVPKHKTVYNNQKVTFRLIQVIVASQQSVIKCLLGTKTQICAIRNNVGRHKTSLTGSWIYMLAT